MECGHSKLEVKMATRDVAGLTFRYKTEVCAECGAAFWNSEIDERFSSWLTKQGQEARDKFKVQKVKLSSNLIDQAESLSKTVGKVDKSIVFRACIAVYLNRLLPDEEMREYLDSLHQAASDTKSTTRDDHTDFRLNPKLYVELSEFAQLADLSIADAASEIIERVLIAMQKAQPIVVSEVETVLKAA